MTAHRISKQPTGSATLARFRSPMVGLLLSIAVYYEF